MSRLPTPGQDNGNWGEILNDFLEQAHNADGSLKETAISTKEDVSNKSTNVTTDGTSDTKYPSVKAVKDYVDPIANDVSELQNSGVDTVARAQLADIAENVTTLNDVLLISANENVFDNSTSIQNKLVGSLDGILYDNTYWSTTEAYDVSNIDMVTLGYGTTRYVFYDTNNAYISGGTQGNNANHQNAEFSVPVNAKYMRVSVYMDYASSAKIYLCPLAKVDSALMVGNITIAQDGTGDYTTLRRGIGEAIKHKNSVVYVAGGTYDLLAEFVDIFSATLTTQQGIKLENDVKVIFSSAAKVSCLYGGASVDKIEFFSPFYAGANGGFTIENLNISATNTRYCIHDDQNAATVGRNNNIINCQFDYDNTTGVRNWYPQCIGGGCSKSLKVLVRGCYFKSKYAETNNTPLVSYHNTDKFTDAVANIFIENNYFADNGTFRCTYYGNSEVASKAYVNNNSCGILPYAGYEVNGATTPQNFELIAYNNEIRNS